MNKIDANALLSISFNDKTIPIRIFHLCPMTCVLCSVYSYHRTILTDSVLNSAVDGIIVDRCNQMQFH